MEKLKADTDIVTALIKDDNYSGAKEQIQKIKTGIQDGKYTITTGSEQAILGYLNLQEDSVDRFISDTSYEEGLREGMDSIMKKIQSNKE